MTVAPDVTPQPSDPRVAPPRQPRQPSPPRQPRSSLRYAWASPNSLLGLIVAPSALLSPHGSARVVGGVLELHSPLIASVMSWTFAEAITFGHVVLGRSADALERHRAHERVHVRQYELWGPFFIPAYLIASLIAWARGGRAYRDNVFEREAYGDRGRP